MRKILYSTAATGVFYDSGGPFNYYNNYEDCGLLISPGCAESITIDISYYSTEYGYEWIRLYDGTDENAPLILDMQYLFAPQTVTLYSGSVYVSWHSDYSNVGDGFRATWTSSLVAPTPPEIDLFDRFRDQILHF